MNQASTTIVRAVEPRNQIGDESLALGWMEWTAIFFVAILFCMMAFIAVQGIVRKFFAKPVETRGADGGTIERFRQYKETWNKVAKDCIEMGKDCDKLERSIGISPCKPKDAKKSKLNGKRDEKDPVMPDNQEWGEW